ncbi:uracil phosphoribosyltransferase [Peptoanaerobacter stomatis]|uniref:Uracil phosphoribosyltransferase n=1 Tax=Peptoanaerobacter stomatis TaxID=796937 RepID=J6HJV1_9FIRM|nr:uracil phosphoribosyltransferase [Peptoanaerobacter stomatis]EHL14847.1 uracil phosphoribosyltransferase [Peptoanaerobacter stomatis]EJU22903.1 uracil phosphoribosyltransferase [Peptoanaerobacter stomatis]NWO25536.1 uracil phosphoribosyltransferase [Peptostreptococcaceae bacterium oral taxon 081]
MSKLTILDHPLIQHKIAIARNKNTGSGLFRQLVKEIGMLMVYEVTRDLTLEDVEIETPICKTKAKMLRGKKMAVVPILRAGIGMVDGILELVPQAKVGHIGLYRDPVTKEPVEYFCKLPQDVAQRDFILVDPMLATGGSASAAITLLKNKNIKSIRLVCLVGCPEGVKRVQTDHPDIDIYLASLDEKLNEDCYIVPGLGDAGDRIFGTK